ncbi:hypothetical protein GQ457_12G032620 [Hibiscus cannabinus]
MTAMHHLCLCSQRHSSLLRGFATCQALIRFFALHRIKPHAPPFVRALINFFEFHSCERTPQAGYLTLLAQQSAFVVGVLSVLYTFLHFTGNFLCPYPLRFDGELKKSPTGALRLIILNNACILCITAAAGTKLSDAYLSICGRQ